MNASPEELDELRDALMVDDGGASALGWAAVHAFEAEHGIVLPEPYRSFVAEVSDGSFAGPPDDGLLGLAEMPADIRSRPPERAAKAAGSVRSRSAVVSPGAAPPASTSR